MSTQQTPLATETNAYRQPQMTLRMSRSGPVTLVAVSGEVDPDDAHLIPELVDCLTDDQPQRIVLDLAQVTFLSAAGVEALLRVRDAVLATAGQLILRNPSPVVLTVLAASRVTHGFHIHTSRQARRASSSPDPARLDPGRQWTEAPTRQPRAAIRPLDL